MKRLSKDRKGFTLVEMVLVIAIIVILASVFMLGIGFYLEAANVAAASVTQHNESVDYVTEEVIGQTPGLQ
ncbi:MAG: type II secretion system protein [Clostridiales bacterium]|nr:type II secretion system protein [Clostridiales bacterium]MCR4670627.1 type II secretion system GspH family protein [Saccharofermentans sp.]